MKIFSRLKEKKVKTKFDVATILNDKTSFTIKESYKIARTNILFSLTGEEGCKKLIITSPTPGDGKTITCVNLAITFAQLGAKVLLLDADLRRPKTDKRLDMKYTNGLTAILGGFCEIREAIYKDTIHGLDCIFAGVIPPNPAELLSSATMEKVLIELEKEYDYIFIDTPPIDVVTDALSFCKLITGFVVVVRQKISTHDIIEKSLATLQFANVKVLGFILNDAEYENRRYKYSYKRKYGYKYGYKYGSKYGGYKEYV